MDSNWCRNCGKPNHPDRRFCWNCGAKIDSENIRSEGRTIGCPVCHTLNPVGINYCGNCGATLHQVQRSDLLDPIGTELDEEAHSEKRSSPGKIFVRSCLVLLIILTVGLSGVYLVSRFVSGITIDIASLFSEPPSTNPDLNSQQISSEISATIGSPDWQPSIVPTSFQANLFTAIPTVESLPSPETQVMTQGQGDSIDNPDDFVPTREPLDQIDENSILSQVQLSNPTVIDPQGETIESAFQNGVMRWSLTGSSSAPPGVDPTICTLATKYRSDNFTRDQITCVRSIMVLVHGINSSPAAFKPWIEYFNGRNFQDLENTLVVEINWSWSEANFVTEALSASAFIGNRANYQEDIPEVANVIYPPFLTIPKIISGPGMSHTAWFAVYKLKQVVSMVQDIFPEVPITIVSHSQGTEVTMAALVEGMRVRNWILMGSPLNQGIVSMCYLYDEKTDINLAATNVADNIWNFYSSADNIAILKGGIGTFGLAYPCGTLPSYSNGYDSRIWQTHVPDMGHTDWWKGEKLFNNLSNANRGALIHMLRGNFVQYAYPNSEIDRFYMFPAAIAKSPPQFMQSNTSPNVPYSFQDHDYDQFYDYIFLPPGMLNGWYMDDKDTIYATVNCSSNNVSALTQQAVWYSFEWADQPFMLPSNRNVEGCWHVPGRLDATVWIGLYNHGNEMAYCHLWMSGSDDPPNTIYVETCRPAWWLP